MREILDFFVTERTENHARLLLAPRKDSGISQITGVVRGPYSDFSKTLTADSLLKSAGTPGTVEALIVEPCYWTPSLPFWYDLRLTLKFSDGSTRDEVFPIGIKRFYCERRNFLFEGKRIVLRGLKIEAPTQEQLEAARKCETAFIVKHATEEICQQASRSGVPLLVDLRGSDITVSSALDWYSAVLLLLVSADQVGTLSPRGVQYAVCLDAAGDAPIIQCDAYAIELRSGERPPRWAATCGRPVIAIRKDPEADIPTARAGCDRLQAELAPEFDLAGYFV
jgi:hypothetical protein